MNSNFQIVPAIIPKDFTNLERQVKQVEGLVEWVQLDIVDGIFAPARTWDEPELLNELTGRIKLEAHLMVSEPEFVVDDWLRVVDRIVIHYESTKHLAEIWEKFAEQPKRFGLALLLETPLGVLDDWRGRLAHIQLMSIAKIGAHGQKLDERVLPRLRAVREKFPDATIAVDGGINLRNAPALLAAGANQLVVGSAIWRSENVAAAIKNFQNLTPTT